MTLVIDLLPRDHLKTFEQGLGLAPPMGLDDTNDDIDPFAPLSLSRQKHLVGLTDAGCGAEKDLQPSALFLLCRCEQRLRRRSSFALRHRINIEHSGRLDTSGWCGSLKRPTCARPGERGR